MLLPMPYHLADIIAFLNVVEVGTTLHYMYGLIMADVIARWQMCNRMEWVHPNTTANTRFSLYLNTKQILLFACQNMLFIFTKVYS